jgi:hypothetical protein
LPTNFRSAGCVTLPQCFAQLSHESLGKLYHNHGNGGDPQPELPADRRCRSVSGPENNVQAGERKIRSRRSNAAAVEIAMWKTTPIKTARPWPKRCGAASCGGSRLDVERRRRL